VFLQWEEGPESEGKPEIGSEREQNQNFYNPRGCVRYQRRRPVQGGAGKKRGLGERRGGGGVESGD